jgi:hypothetical protein
VHGTRVDDIGRSRRDPLLRTGQSVTRLVGTEFFHASRAAEEVVDAHKAITVFNSRYREHHAAHGIDCLILAEDAGRVATAARVVGRLGGMTCGAGGHDRGCPLHGESWL